MEPKRFISFKRKQSIVLDVCGGIAEYFNVVSGFDPAWNGFVYLRQCWNRSFGIFYCVSDHAGSEIGE